MNLTVYLYDYYIYLYISVFCNDYYVGR